MKDLLQMWIVPVLLYSGPVLPLAGALALGGRRNPHFSRNRALLIFLMVVQFLAFVPFGYHIATSEDPGVWFLLSIPALLGAAMFVGSAIYFVIEFIGFLHAKRTSVALRSR